LLNAQVAKRSQQERDRHQQQVLERERGPFSLRRAFESLFETLVLGEVGIHYDAADRAWKKNHISIAGGLAATVIGFFCILYDRLFVLGSAPMTFQNTDIYTGFGFPLVFGGTIVACFALVLSQRYVIGVYRLLVPRQDLFFQQVAASGLEIIVQSSYWNPAVQVTSPPHSILQSQFADLIGCANARAQKMKVGSWLCFAGLCAFFYWFYGSLWVFPDFLSWLFFSVPIGLEGIIAFGYLWTELARRRVKVYAVLGWNFRRALKNAMKASPR
jgi:hypothetical protein